MDDVMGLFGNGLGLLEGCIMGQTFSIFGEIYKNVTIQLMYLKVHITFTVM